MLITSSEPLKTYFSSFNAVLDPEDGFLLVPCRCDRSPTLVQTSTHSLPLLINLSNSMVKSCKTNRQM